MKPYEEKLGWGVWAELICQGNFNNIVSCVAPKPSEATQPELYGFIMIVTAADVVKIIIVVFFFPSAIKSVTASDTFKLKIKW